NGKSISTKYVPGNLGRRLGPALHLRPLVLSRRKPIGDHYDAPGFHMYLLYCMFFLHKSRREEEVLLFGNRSRFMLCNLRLNKIQQYYIPLYSFLSYTIFIPTRRESTSLL
ncbi:MAG: hypothetical protein ACI4OX_03740, partial [Akkermansia sp.]